MNESYVEHMVARKPNPLAGAAKILAYALAVILFFLGFFGNYWLLLPAVILLLLGYFVIPQLNLEFEYLYLDKEITIDKIIDKQKRKHVMTVDLNKVEFLAPYTSHEFDSHKARKVMEKDVSGRIPGSRPYGMLYHDEKGDSIIIFEPNEEMLKAIRTVFPRKVIDL